jgi:mRNA-degrading endonuclease YafQ of YafQ-DinJ toxin-antitoxin module
MKVAFSENFKKVFAKKIKKNKSLETLFFEKLELFIADPFDPKLKTHKLSGRLDGAWSFTIDFDCRAIFFFTSDKPTQAVFFNFGSHDEVY